jgi:hypothetical protein
MDSVAFLTVWGILIRIRMFLDLPDPDPLVRGTDPGTDSDPGTDPAPAPSPSLLS